MAEASNSKDETAGQNGQPNSIKFASVTNGFPFHAVVQEPSPVAEKFRTTVGSGRGGEAESTQDGLDITQVDGGTDHIGETHESTPQAKSTAEVSAPPGRRSVQFARPSAVLEQGDANEPSAPSTDAIAGDASGRRGSSSIFSKLKSLASSSHNVHTRSPSGYTIGENSIDERFAVFTPDSENPSSQYADGPQGYGSQSDADSEESAGEGPADPRPRKRRKSRRPQDGGAQTAPATPKTPFMRDDRLHIPQYNSQGNTNGRLQPPVFPRRTSLPDMQSERQVVSEDEGRQRINNGSPWRRRPRLRGIAQGSSRKHTHQADSETPRPSPFRRALTGFGSFAEPGGESAPSQWKLRSERTASLSAAKWRQITAGLRMIGRQRKAQVTVDHVKSAELLAELTAGVPAALMLASMFQRDEHGNRRIPILLEQLKVRLTDSTNIDSRSGDRHVFFRIELEYGNGLTRMKWVVHRTLRDFTNLHTKYKFQVSAQKYIQRKSDDTRTKLPRFPRSAFPILRGIRGTGMSESDDDDDGGDGTAPSGNETSGPERPNKKKRQSSMSVMRRKSSIGGSFIPGGGSITGIGGGSAGNTLNRRDPWPERQRRKLEIYLQQLIRFLMFRPESNRLCKFLELSALGIRLSAEGSYHGKEGFLVIQSGKGVDFRRAWKPGMVKNRHGPKWFLVRHSYIVCVDSPEEMNIYDVFLVDSDFRMQAKRERLPLRDQNAKTLAKTAKESAAHPQHHSLKLYNAERKMKLFAKHERQLNQFEDSIQHVISTSQWAKKNRFDSFAPVRSNVFVQWLVDGRDYMWNVSRAISKAKDVIYIHDWWLSPELYMRRPAAISKKWRLDRLLRKKAQEGVKVYVIVYRNINSAIPIDSEYSKFSLLDLDRNVFVQRSPNQIRQGTFFWAHHEKVCIVDHTIAFVGGIDLCFGRWDTPAHVVTDDKLTGFENSNVPKDSDHCQLWPGKDYSNPRVQDFYALDKPYEEMYDRSKVPRMPWHDIGMQIVGQPARDLTRHFVQRWNYILRQRKPTRPTPFLLPPPDYRDAELKELGIDGTCEVQVLRSCAMWSMGTPDKIERSIMNAYVKMIQQSDHFIYIENQFFVSSCEVEGTRVENTIGDALVERIIRAHENEEAWRAVILIPLMPGFQNTVDSQDGTSIRLIMQCQFRSINRGDQSIFGRLRAAGIEPEDYIQFYSLRSWGRIGPDRTVVSEQLYIHAKCMIVDDRIAIIGSANINERSMLGNRDSEVAAVIRDTDMIWSTMNGDPYLVGRFPHTLRMRLMREHLGLDVDEIMAEEVQQKADEEWDREMQEFADGDQGRPDPSTKLSQDQLEQQRRVKENTIARNEVFHSFNHDADREQANNPNLQSNKKMTSDPRVTGNEAHKKDIDGEGADRMKADPHGLNSRKYRGRRETEASSKSTTERRSKRERSASEDVGNTSLPPSRLSRLTTSQHGLPMLSQLPALPKTDDTDIGGPPIQQKLNTKCSALVHNIIAAMKRPHVEKDCMRDPVNDEFYNDIWHTVAENNTSLFRSVFRCMPDNEVKTWKEYKEYVTYADRFAQVDESNKAKDTAKKEGGRTSGPPGASSNNEKLRNLVSIGESAEENKLSGVVSSEVSFDEKTPSRKPEISLAKTKTPNTANAGAFNEKQPSPPPLSLSTSTTPPPPQQPPAARDEKSALKLDTAFTAPPETVLGEAPTSDARVLSPTIITTTDGTGGGTGGDAAISTSPSGNKILSPTTTGGGSIKRRRRNTTRSSRREFRAADEMIGQADALELLGLVQGHLVVWPYDW